MPLRTDPRQQARLRSAPVIPTLPPPAAGSQPAASLPPDQNTPPPAAPAPVIAFTDEELATLNTMLDDTLPLTPPEWPE